jgi:hypothetical protein
VIIAIGRGPPLQSLSGHFGCAIVRYKRLEQPGLRSHDPHVAIADLDPLGEHVKVLPVIGAIRIALPLAGDFGECPQFGGGDLGGNASEAMLARSASNYACAFSACISAILF